jgi:hypothetical protein
MNSLEHLNDEALTQRLAAARAAVNAPSLLAQLEAEHQRRHTQQQKEVAERDALLKKLIAQRDEYRARFWTSIGTLDVTAPSDTGPLIEAAYTVGRQAHALAHDLAGITGDRHLGLPWDVTDQLELHGGQAGKSFVANLRGHSTTVPTPWKADVERLRAIWGTS